MKQEKKNNKPYLLVFVIFILLSFGYYKSQNSKEKLLNFNTTHGTIIEIQERFQRGYFIRYSYNISGNQYFNNQNLTVKKEDVSIGDVFEVKYSVENENVSELNFKKKIN